MGKTKGKPGEVTPIFRDDKEIKEARRRHPAGASSLRRVDEDPKKDKTKKSSDEQE